MGDDYSRSTWVFLLQHKHSIACLLENLCLMVRTQFNKLVKVVRSDRGTEFVNSEFTQVFQKLGTIHEQTCSYTPQQNDIVERKHKSILQIAWALMFHGKLPKRFWGEDYDCCSYFKQNSLFCA